MNLFSKIYNFKVNDFDPSEHQVIRLTNFFAFMCFFICILYGFYYLLVLDSFHAFIFTEFFGSTYLLYFYIFHKGQYFPAVVTLTSTYMFQVFVIVVFFLSTASGVHFFLFLTGPSMYILPLKGRQRIFKTIVGILSLILFLTCEIIGSKYAIIKIGKKEAYSLYIVTMLIVFFFTFLIIYLFQREIDKREERLKKRAEELSTTNEKLKTSIDRVKTLSGLLPICYSCKKIRDDKGYWSKIELYIDQHTDAEISHGICPECAKKMYGDEEWYEDV